jgi:hypothetical protein
LINPLDISLMTALAVFVHLGTGIASMLMKDKTDQAKIAQINAKTDQILNVVTAVAPAVPAAAPKTVSQIAGDIADLAAALAAATKPNAPAALNAPAAPGGGF